MVWIVFALTILLILVRPGRVPEAFCACAGAMALLMLRAITLSSAWSALARGLDVYLFLTGMMLLAELARREGLFDWIAGAAVTHAKGSRRRLFTIVYLVGVLVTAFLSNDATAVVLTPAVLAVVRKAKAKPLPYLLICAFVANAASFILPISNPANLVIYGAHMPPLITWIRTFALPSAASVVVTFLLLRFLSRRNLQGTMEAPGLPVSLSATGKLSAYGILGTAFVLLGASFLGVDLGLPTCLAAAVACSFVAFRDAKAPLALVKQVSWSVLPLVGGLFILVEGINQAGAVGLAQHAVRWAASLPHLQSALVSAFGIAALSNVINNLPAGLIVGQSIHASGMAVIRDALLIGIDLGPNLSVAGSLATILWLMAIRREGESIGAWQFLGYGIVVMPAALVASLLLLR